MAQSDLFTPAQDAVPARAPDTTYIRKHMIRVLRILRAAERMPWSESETRSWEKLFPDLARHLPEKEGEEMRRAFEAELKRLRGC